MSNDYDIKKLLGKRIKNIRRAKNITQETMAEKIGIEPPSLSNIERGKFAPSIETLQKISQILEVAPYELYMFEAEKPIPIIKNEIMSAINKDDKLARLLHKFLQSVR